MKCCLFSCCTKSSMDYSLLSQEEKNDVAPGETGDAPLVVFLADFDDCFDVLSRAIKSHSGFDRDKVDAIADNFLQHLMSLADGRDVECLSISARQDKKYDDLVAEKKSNGKSFEEFPRLCEENGWTFDNHLLPDDNLCGWDGSSFHGWTSAGSCCDFWVDKADRFLQKMKFGIINSQLKHLAEKYPGRPMIAHFFDHRNDIVNALCADLHGMSLIKNFHKFVKTYYKMSSADRWEYHGTGRQLSDVRKIVRLQQEGDGTLLQIPKDMILHLHRANWSKEYKDMGNENRVDVHDFVTDPGVFTSNAPVFDSSSESKEGVRVPTLG